MKILLVFVLFAAFQLWSGPGLLLGPKGNGSILSAQPEESKKLNVGMGLEIYPGSSLGLMDTVGNLLPESSAGRRDLSLGVGYGLTPFISFGGGIPVFWDQDFRGEHFSGLGDLQMFFKLNYPPYPHPDGWDLSYFLRLGLPTGSGEANGGYPRHIWHINNDDPSETGHFSAKSWVLDLRLLNTADLSVLGPQANLRFHLNWGLVLTKKKNENAFVAGGGVEYTPLEFLDIFWGFDTEVPVRVTRKDIPLFEYPIRSDFGLNGRIPNYPLEISGGMRFIINPNDSLLPVSSQSAPLQKMNRYPELGFFVEIKADFQLSKPDLDGDGIIDSQDKCMDEPEDIDQFNDHDGCPDENNDGDRLNDIEDQCPDEPEDLDGYLDEDGCPDDDNDRDGVPDKYDRNPLLAEDMDGFEDDDGVPDLDNDRDGIPDESDDCPDQKEDKDGFQDEDGCVDPDNDGDNFPDSTDQCPDQPETVNGFQDEDGCPDQPVDENAELSVKPMDIPIGVKHLEDVNFKTGTTELTFQARQALKPLVTALKVHPEFKVRFRVYAQRLSNPKETRELTENQARSLRDYLIEQGVKEEQIASSEGRGAEKNEYRVEMKRVK